MIVTIKGQTSNTLEAYIKEVAHKMNLPTPNFGKGGIEIDKSLLPKLTEIASEKRTRFTNYKEVILMQKVRWMLQGSKPAETEIQPLTVENSHDILSAPLVAFDVETTGLDFKGDYIRTMAWTIEQGKAIVLEVKEPLKGWQVNFLMMWLSDATGKIVAHNSKFDLHFLFELIGYNTITSDFFKRVEDTMLMAFICDSEYSKGLKAQVELWLPEFSGYAIAAPQNEEDMEALLKYNGQDTDVTFRLYHILRKMLERNESWVAVYENYFKAANYLTFKMEHRGLPVDVALLQATKKKAEIYREQLIEQLHKVPQVDSFLRATFEADKQAKIEKLEAQKEKLKSESAKHKKQIAIQEALQEQYDWQKHGINIDSHVQMGKLIYTDPNGYRIPVEKPTMNEKQMPDAVKELDCYQIYRRLKTLGKLYSTYLVGIEARLTHENRIHTTYNIAGTQTGRLSSQNPNLQNLPSRSYIDDEIIKEVVKSIKKLFVVPMGCSFVDYDYSQAELRLMAFYSQDKTMNAVYKNGLDLHAMTAANSLGLSYENFMQLPPEKRAMGRYKAKAQNFGLIYLQGAFGFMNYAKQQYGIEMNIRESEALIKKFFSSYPRIKDYHKRAISAAEMAKGVNNLFGFFRRIPHISAPEGAQKGEAQRAAVNTPIQGTAGMYTIWAAYQLDQLFKDEKEWFIMATTVHDSVGHFVEAGRENEFMEAVKQVCEQPQCDWIDTPLPRLPIDFSVSTKSWGDCKEI